MELARCGGGARREARTSGVDVAPVQDDQTGQQQWLMVVVVVRATPHTSGQQDAPLPLVMEHQGEQRHHQDEDDGAADDGVGDAGVVAQAVVQCDEVLAWSLCCSQAELFVTVVLTVVLAIAQEASVYTVAVATLEASLRAHQWVTAVFLVAPIGTVAEAVAAESSDNAVDTISTGEECRGALRLDLRTAFLVTLVEAVGQSVTLPPARDALPIAAHEVSRDVALGGEVIPWEQLALDSS